MASLKNAVVRLRNLAALMGDGGGEERSEHQRRSKHETVRKRSGPPLLSCRVPQLQVDLLTPT